MNIKGRGAQINVQNRYEALTRDEKIDPLHLSDNGQIRSQYLPVTPKTIVNKVASPDVGMAYSINPYQGCEHGCAYCYARNTHNYWGYSAGLDFESKILYKANAPQLLKQFLRKPSWEGTPIALSGNTDCYQPIERKMRITRQLLEVFAAYEHPTAVISKNSMILRDLDLLKPMAEKRLFKAAISLNTLDDSLRRTLEPRTASVSSRINTIRRLADAGIPVKVMIAPVIPGLNSHDVMPLVEQAASWGAHSVGFIVVRLNGDVGAVFSDWIRKAFPHRAEKVLGQIEQMHGGQLSDSRFGTRMRGEGPIAEVLKKQFEVSRQRFFGMTQDYALDSSLFRRQRKTQLSLFGDS
ncbi:MAG: PA0069 family radical SAM protein [Saprospiraceae bacterium]|nr:PA0069 family radical SAM protein [Saprospiraceae bacterium]